jgi:hypothetical protein
LTPSTLLWPLAAVLGLPSFVCNKLPVNGTVVPKHVAVGTGYEVGFMICFVVFCFVRFVVFCLVRSVGLKYGV